MIFIQLTKSCPQPCLEWMSSQVTRNKLASHWILSQRESWVEPYLIANNNARVRNGKFTIGKFEKLTVRNGKFTMGKSDKLTVRNGKVTIGKSEKLLVRNSMLIIGKSEID